MTTGVKGTISWRVKRKWGKDASSKKNRMFEIPYPASDDGGGLARARRHERPQLTGRALKLKGKTGFSGEQGARNAKEAWRE